MVEYDGYDINEYHFEYPVNAAGYLTMYHKPSIL